MLSDVKMPWHFRFPQPLIHSAHTLDVPGHSRARLGAFSPIAEENARNVLELTVPPKWQFLNAGITE